MDSQSENDASLFPDTRWSLVVNAQNPSSETGARRALEQLCQNYWYPLYAYLKGTGFSTHDAEDRTQAFFSQFLSRGAFDKVRQEKGRLRAFLKSSLRNFNRSEWRRETAQKRGGTTFHFSTAEWEEQMQIPDASTQDPIELFDRNWAFTVLKSVFNRLEAHYEKRGKQDLYAAIKDSVQGDGTYEAGNEIAERLKLSPEGVRSAVFQIRRRFRDYMREEIADTCSDPDEAREELAYLCRILTTQS